MKRPRVKLIDDSAFAIRREKFARPKPDAWFRSDKHLSYIAGLRCLGCGREPPERATDDNPRNQATHIRIGTDGAAKRKPSDYFTLPLCARCHAVQHMGERSFYARHHIALPEAGVLGEPIAVALYFAMKSPCERTREAAFEIYRERYG
jgi:hypothetical protein